MTELATKLQQKIRTYKKQIEEAEEIAALNLAKFRKAQQELEETEERSKLAEGQMSLAELGQVEGSNFLSLLNLLLVSPDLLLELGGQLGHPVLVLVVLILLELELLDTALRLLEALVGLRSPGLSGAKLHLQLPYPLLQLGHGIAATLGCHVIGILQTSLQLSDLAVKSPPSLLLGVSMILFRAELISKPSSINHRLLGLLLRVLGLREHVVNFSMHGMNSGLKVTLLSRGLGVDGGHVIDSRPGVSQLHLCLLLAAVSRVQKGPSLLKLSLESVGPALSKSSLLHDFPADTGLLFKGAFNLPELTLVALDGLLGLRVSLVGMIKSNLQLIDVRLQLLLDPQSLALALVSASR